ncbi:cell division protein ZapA [Caenimonas sp. SL110]|uniref:cell division protein ZapA n=1 Tax=Caenimonas sp. SL110 TaxID=1450524 RepID=UPI000653AABA|nr:cell division protein ZapA [Caenimonas sp. SL110]
MKQLEVQIMGQSYLLACPEGGEQRLLDAVERVDTAMCKIRDAGKVKARDRIAVLAALNLAFDVSDRGAAAMTAPVIVAAQVPPPAAVNGSGHEGDDPRLASLLQRLDGVLGGDGQLL